MKRGMTIEYLMCREDLNFEVDFGVNGAIGTIVTKWDLNPIRSGLFQTVKDPGGGALKAPPLGSRKLLCQSSPYHTCEFYQVFLA